MAALLHNALLFARKIPLPSTRDAVKFVSTLLAFLAGFRGAALLSQAMWFGWQARHENRRGKWDRVSTRQAVKPTHPLDSFR